MLLPSVFRVNSGQRRIDASSRQDGMGIIPNPFPQNPNVGTCFVGRDGGPKASPSRTDNEDVGNLGPIFFFFQNSLSELNHPILAKKAVLRMSVAKGMINSTKTEDSRAFLPNIGLDSDQLIN